MDADSKVCPYCAETIKAAAIKCRYCGSDLTDAAPAAAAAQDPAAEDTQDTTAEDTPAEERATGAAEVADESVEPVESVESEASGASAKSAAISKAKKQSGGVSTSSTGVPPRRVESGGVSPLPGIEEDLPDAPPTRGSGAPFLARPALTAALVVLIGVLLAAAFVVNKQGSDDGTASDGQVVDAQTRSVALTQASELVQNALSYSYQNVEKVRQANRGKMTAAFRKQYDAEMKSLIAKTKKYQITLKTTVVASGVQSISAHQAKVLLFLNQVTSAESGPDKTPTTQLNRAVVTLTRAEGDWQIDGIDPLAGGS